MKPRTTAAIDGPSIFLRFSTEVVGSRSSRQQQQQHLDHDGREPDFETNKKKERDRGTVGGPQQTGRCKETGLRLGRLWETAKTRPCHLASAARRPRRGRTHTRARPSRLRAIDERKPRDETRPRGGEIAEKRLLEIMC